MPSAPAPTLIARNHQIGMVGIGDDHRVSAELDEMHHSRAIHRGEKRRLHSPAVKRRPVLHPVEIEA